MNYQDALMQGFIWSQCLAISKPLKSKLRNRPVSLRPVFALSSKITGQIITLFLNLIYRFNFLEENDENKTQ
jgi:hypothetical protein